MKRLGKIVVCLASGLVLNAGARADDGVLPNNPYVPIVVRNIFSLNPVPTNDVNATPVEPPPKITPNGIMSIFDHQLQVLFKVAGTAKPGQPAKDDFYILGEGQRQDEIEVTHIDEKASLVTFNNHGTVQELPLVKANPPVVTTPTPGRPVPTQNFPAPNGQNNSTIPPRFGGDRSAGAPGAARNRGRGDGSPLTTVPTRGLGGGMNSGSSFNTMPASTSYGGQQQPQNTMTPEAQAIMVEAQREYYKSQNNPIHTLLPPTPLTPPDATGPTGNPLVMPPTP